MCGVHLAEIPLHAEDDVTSHNEPIGILFIIGRYGMGKITRLIQDVVDLDAQVKGAYILGNLRIPAPLALAVTGRISLIEHLGLPVTAAISSSERPRARN